MKLGKLKSGNPQGEANTGSEQGIKEGSELFQRGDKGPNEGLGTGESPNSTNRMVILLVKRLTS